MKKTTLFILLISFSAFNLSYSQSDFLNINNIRAKIDPNTLFYDISGGSSSFESPSGNGTHTIFSASLWLAGKDQTNAIKTNINTFFNANQKIAGPLMTSTLYVSEGVNWDKVWKIQCQEIQEFVSWYECTQDPNCNDVTNFPGYQIPSSILDWPANGDITKGQAANLAPFYDRNGDQFYDPNTGDFPLIKGDEAIYFIYNDERPFFAGNDTHSPMKTEVHGMVYAFSTNDTHINNTVFLNYKIYNRSSINYDSCYVGFWADFDIGNAQDDYIASDVARGSFYGYNAVANDQDNPGNGTLGYGDSPPAQSVTFLKGAKQDNDNIDNPFTQVIQDVIDSSGTPYIGNGLGFGDNTVDNEHWGLEHFMYYNIGGGVQGSPTSEKDYYNLLSGKWNDDSQMVWGGSGHSQTGGTTPSKYLFPGNSDPLLYGTKGISPPPSNWSEFNGATGGLPNNSGDRRGVGSSGPFTFLAGSSVEIDLALVFGRGVTGSGLQAGVSAMQEAIDTVRSQYLLGITSGCADGVSTNITNIKSDKNTLIIYPKPFNNQFTINYKLESNDALIEIYSVVGKKIKTQTINQNSTVVDLNNQPDGFYFVTITDGNKKLSQKIIKQ